VRLRRTFDLPAPTTRLRNRHNVVSGQAMIGDTADIIANNQIDQKVVELSSSQRYSLVENSM